MMEIVKNCKEHNIKVGAHPGLPDLQGSGCREMKLSPEGLTAIKVYQVGVLRDFLERENLTLHLVKPHGVLYGMMCQDYDVAQAVTQEIPKAFWALAWLGRTWKRLPVIWVFHSGRRCMAMPNIARMVC
jgi:lactam utilization protein B